MSDGFAMAAHIAKRGTFFSHPLGRGRTNSRPGAPTFRGRDVVCSGLSGAGETGRGPFPPIPELPTLFSKSFYFQPWKIWGETGDGLAMADAHCKTGGLPLAPAVGLVGLVGRVGLVGQV